MVVMGGGEDEAASWEGVWHQEGAGRNPLVISYMKDQFADFGYAKKRMNRFQMIKSLLYFHSLIVNIQNQPPPSQTIDQ